MLTTGNAILSWQMSGGASQFDWPQATKFLVRHRCIQSCILTALPRPPLSVRVVGGCTQRVPLESVSTKQEGAQARSVHLFDAPCRAVDAHVGALACATFARQQQFNLRAPQFNPLFCWAFTLLRRAGSGPRSGET